MTSSTPTTLVPTGNTYDKYHTPNPVARYLMGGFLRAFDELTAEAEFASVLEVGCGEGELLRHLLRRHPVQPAVGFDIGATELQQARKLNPQAELFLGDAHHLPFADRSFDLVVACEVLEHVQDPYRVLREMARVTRRFVLVSVPREPLWRTLNMMRGYYLPELGNTPGHINHWGSRQFRSTVAAIYNVREVRRPLPWTMVLAETKTFERWNEG